jgi:hypothetical protein
MSFTHTLFLVRNNGRIFYGALFPLSHLVHDTTVFQLPNAFLFRIRSLWSGVHYGWIGSLSGWVAIETGKWTNRFSKSVYIILHSLRFDFFHWQLILSRGNKDRSLTTYNFETIHNIDEYSAETSDVRGSMRAWNMTVQWWLVVNVHRRFPVKPLRTVVTMLISAFWHGVHSGYYLSMLTVPYILLAEDAIKKKLRPLMVSYLLLLFYLFASNESFSLYF